MYHWHLQYPKVKSLQDKAKLTGTSVVAFWVPHTKVSHGAGGKAHAYLTDVTALQVHEELGPTFNAAIILRASLTAFGARWWPLSTNCGNIRYTERKEQPHWCRKHGVSSHKNTVSSQIWILISKRKKNRLLLKFYQWEQHQGDRSRHKPASTLSLQHAGVNACSLFYAKHLCLNSYSLFTSNLLREILNRFIWRNPGNWRLTVRPVKIRQLIWHRASTRVG